MERPAPSSLIDEDTENQFLNQNDTVPAMVAPTCSQDEWVGESKGQGHLWLHGKPEASLGYGGGPEGTLMTKETTRDLALTFPSSKTSFLTHLGSPSVPTGEPWDRQTRWRVREDIWCLLPV